MILFRVICLDDSSRPESIPTSAWVKKNKMYNVIKVDRIRMQGGAMGYKLLEIDLDPYFPYQYFGAWRFGIVIEDNTLEEEVDELLDKIYEEAQKEELGLIENA